MAQADIYLGEDFLLTDGLGVGFFGKAGFGAPVVVGEFNGRTFVTDASGVTEGFEANNNKRLGASTVIHGQEGSGINLLQLPNSFATINIRFENAIPVRTLSPKFYIFDGTFNGSGIPNFATPQTGLTMWCAEIRHLDEEQTATGIGSSDWIDINGPVFLALIDSPGTLGGRPGGVFTTDTRHDWYVAMSCSPTELGDKSFGLYFEVEFL